MADIVYELMATLALDSSGFSDDLYDARKQLGSSGLQGVATRISNGVTAAVTKGTKALLSFGRTAISIGMDFDATMSAVKAVSGANAEEFDQLREAAMLMGRTTKFTATESAQALYYMGMAGWDANQMIEGLPAIMRLAAASGEDLATVSDIVTDSLTAYGLTADDAAHYADVLAATATSSNTNVYMLGETFKYAAPLAGALGYSVEDTAVAFGLMANSGIKASMAGTALRGLLTRLAKPTKESTEAMTALGISLSDDQGHMYTFMELMQNMRTSFRGIIDDPAEYAAALAELDEQLENGELTEEEFAHAHEQLLRRTVHEDEAKQELMARLAAQLGGQRALAGLLAIANATDEDFESLMESIYGASEAMALTADGSIIPLTEALERGETVIQEYSGAAEAMSATMLDNLSGDVTLLRSAWEGFQLEFASKITPALREVMPRIIDAVVRLTEKLADVDLSELVEQVGRIDWVRIGTLLGQVIENAANLLDRFLSSGALDLLLEGASRWLFMKSALYIPAAAPAVPTPEQQAAAASAAVAEYARLRIRTENAENYLRTNDEGVEFIDTVAFEADMEAARAIYREHAEELEGLTLEDLRAIAESAETELGGLAEQASTWGGDMISSFTDGVSVKAPALIQTVSGVAAGIASLFAHSEPETGPLSNDSEWMPDMMLSFADGINSNKGIVVRAMTGLAEDMSGAMNPGGLGLAAGSGGHTFNIYVNGGLDSAETIAERISSELSALLGREAAALG